MGLFIMMTGFASAKTNGIFHPKTFVLKNGLQVVVIENHLSPAVSVGLVYKVGTADDPSDMVGLSHFLEHIMFKGTVQIPSGEFKRLIVSKGGQINAQTSYDYTVYTADIAVENLEMLLKIEADRMVNLVFNHKEIEAEQQVVMEERLTRMDNNPWGQAWEALLRAKYWYHPYGVPPIGYPYHIKAYTPQALEAHYKKWYAPNNAILIVSGDVTAETLQPLVEAYFGAIPERSIPKRTRTPEPSHQGLVNHIEFESPRISMVNMSWYFAAPHHFSEQKQHFYPLIVLSHILGGNSNSRLYKTLVDNSQSEGLALNVQADYDGDSLDPQDFEISATLNPTATPQQLKEAVENQIGLLLKTPITEEELQKAKRDLVADIAFARDGNTGAIRTFNRLSVGFSIDDIESWADYIQSVTAEQVSQAAKLIFSANPLAILTLYPQGYKKMANEKMANKKIIPENLDEKVTSTDVIGK